MAATYFFAKEPKKEIKPQSQVAKGTHANPRANKPSAAANLTSKSKEATFWAASCN